MRILLAVFLPGAWTWMNRCRISSQLSGRQICSQRYATQ